MAGKISEKRSASESLDGFLTNYRVAVVSVVTVFVVAILVYGIVITVLTKSAEKGLSEIDMITYTLTNKSSDLSETDLDARRKIAMENLAPLVKKGGIVGVRATMLAAELSFQKKDYIQARTYWLEAAKSGRKSYTVPLAYFNAAVCSEELNDTDSAISYYQKAADTPDFFETEHALFSIGRIKEGKQDFKGAAEVYKKLNDKGSSGSWAQLAKSRLLVLKIAGSIE
jgi:tetratricopeptide (TPR) repeat protein